MKKILSAVISVIAFSSVGANAQTIFIPQPPVVNIPLLGCFTFSLPNKLKQV
jgi:hypothetical protein